MTVDLWMPYLFILVKQNLTLMQGHSGSAKAKNQRCTLSATKQAKSIKLATTVGHFLLDLGLVVDVVVAAVVVVVVVVDVGGGVVVVVGGGGGGVFSAVVVVVVLILFFTKLIFNLYIAPYSDYIFELLTRSRKGVLRTQKLRTALEGALTSILSL